MPVDDGEKIIAEIIQLLQKQFEGPGLATCGGLTDVEWYEYDAREDRIEGSQARLGRFAGAA